MCTVWAALFLFLSLSVSVPLFPTFLLLLVFVVRLLSLSPSLLHFVSQRPFSFSPASFRPSFPILRLCSSLSLSLAFSPSLPLPPGPLRLPLSHALRVPFLSLSLRLSRALDFSPASFTVPRFFLSLVSVYHPSSVRPPPPAPLSAPTSFPFPLSFSRPPCPSLHIPAASVETARFFPPVSSAPIFFTPFFSPLQRLPMRRSLPLAFFFSLSFSLPLTSLPDSRIPPRASARSLSISRHTYAHDLSASLTPSILFLLPFAHLAFLSSLSFFPAFHPRPLRRPYSSRPTLPACRAPLTRLLSF